VEVEKRLALSRFYRDEFLRHIEHLQATGILHEGNREVVHRACQRIIHEIDDVCCGDHFSLVAERLLQSFDTLTQLSRLDPHRGH
jgi:hypothetical protein